MNNISYTISDDLVACVIATAGDHQYRNGLREPVVPAVAGVTYLQATVTVTWRDSTCPAPSNPTPCTYSTSTLLNQSPEPCLNPFQTAPHAADLSQRLTVPQTWTVGDTRTLQLTTPTSTGSAGSPGRCRPGRSCRPGWRCLRSGLISGSATSRELGHDHRHGHRRLRQHRDDADQLDRGDRARRSPRPTRRRRSIPRSATPCRTPARTRLVSSRLSTCPGGAEHQREHRRDQWHAHHSGNGDGHRYRHRQRRDRGLRRSFTWSVLSPATVCVQSIALPNGGFESPVRSAGADTNWLHGNGVTPGLLWNTTEPDNNIEYWHNGGNVQSANGGLPIAAEDGGQWAELNANGVGALYQDLTTVPGQVLQWSVYHRARGVNGNTNDATDHDVMQVQIGSATVQSPQVPTGQATAEHLRRAAGLGALHRRVHRARRPDRHPLSVRRDQHLLRRPDGRQLHRQSLLEQQHRLPGEPVERPGQHRQHAYRAAVDLGGPWHRAVRLERRRHAAGRPGPVHATGASPGRRRQPGAPPSPSRSVTRPLSRRRCRSSGRCIPGRPSRRRATKRTRLGRPSPYRWLRRARTPRARMP